MVLSLVPCQNSYSQNEYYFDLGTSTSSIYPNYQRVSNETVPGTFGWTNTNGINAADRSEFPGLNTLNSDLIYCSSPKTFEVNVPNGTYNVLITFGDPRYQHDKIEVKAEGETKLSNINTQKGNNFFDREFDAIVNDEKLSIEFLDGGGDDENWVATRIIIKQKSILTRIETVKKLKLFKVYPNPATESLNIEVPLTEQNQVSWVKIYNTEGGIVYQNSFRGETNHISVGDFPIGLYILSVISNNEIITHKFIKQ